MSPLDSSKTTIYDFDVEPHFNFPHIGVNSHPRNESESVMAFSNEQIEQLVNQSRESLTAVRGHSEASQIMAGYGFPSGHLDEILDLVDETERAYVAQKMEYSEAHEATQGLNELKGELYGTLSEHRAIARSQLRRQPAALNALSLGGETRRSYDRLVQQAIHFYDVLDSRPEYEERVAPYSLHAEARTKVRTLIARLQTAKVSQTAETFEAEKATASRDALAGELRARMRSFNELAAIGLGKHSQLSELVGITDPGE